MSILATQQQALLDALFAWPADVAIKKVADCAVDARARGLKAYQANGHALAERALQAAYPVVAQMVGVESFTDLSRALWHAQPPERGDVAHWGAGLAAFVQASSQLGAEPYLGDVARCEWALHRCGSAPDAVVDLSTLVLLTTHEPSQLRLILSPGCSVVGSAWPVASILGAHLDGSPSLEEAGALLRAGVGQSAVVWRAGMRPQVRLAVDGEADALRVILSSGSLAHALDAAVTLDFGQWLPMAVHTGLVVAVQATDT